MRTKTIPQRILKRHLPAVLLKHRQKVNKVSVMRKRNAHNPNLPEHLIAKARAAYQLVQNAAVAQQVQERLSALEKQAKANLAIALADTPPVPVEAAT